MNTVIINEQQLQTEINALKTQFPETKDIYREVCVLLFFRYGITPTANKLYQYVRKGSMSAPADALNKFWLELREKSRVRIERSDIPEHIAKVAGDLMANLWNEAQKAAQESFSTLTENATKEILLYKIQAEAAEKKSINLEEKLFESNANLKNTIIQLSEAEKQHLVDTQALTEEKKRLLALQKDFDSLANKLVANKKNFEHQISKLTNKILDLESRHRAHESKFLLEIDRLRQNNKSILSQSESLKKEFQQERTGLLKETATQNKTILHLQNQIGLSEGRLQSTLNMHNDLKKELKQIQRKLDIAERKLAILSIKKTKI